MAITGAIMVPHPPIILPEVGRGEEKKISDTTAAFEAAAEFVAELEPDTIILASPHSVMYSDYFHISPGSRAKGDMGQFRASSVRFDVEYDEELARAISYAADEEHFPAGPFGERSKALDHGTMVPLYFINKKYTKYKLVRIGLSGLSFQEHYRLGKIICKVCDKISKKVVFVASGDLSHKLLAEGPYGFAEEGPEYDRRIMDVMGSANFGELFEFKEDFCERSAECGHGSFCMMAGVFDGCEVEARRLSHEGTFGVGYGICTYRPLSAGHADREFLRIWTEKKLSQLAD
ncbi:MAG: AmmeMemoRadiSam system protein B, partial [Lachnospiraceae bacterium]|nr:AmmeMemoRadiSam system protein B [Lachnospiraceae bacterium]